MTFLDRYVSPASKRNQSRKVSVFSTIHLRIHSDIYELLKQEATDNGLSVPATLEMVLALRYKERIEAQERVQRDLGVDAE